MTDNNDQGSDFKSDQDPLPGRVRELLTDAINRLDPTDRDERIAYCREHNQHGVRILPGIDDDLLEFRWGSRTLLMIPRDLLLGDLPLPEPQFIADTPDTVPDEWGQP